MTEISKDATQEAVPYVAIYECNNCGEHYGHPINWCPICNYPAASIEKKGFHLGFSVRFYPKTRPSPEYLTHA